MLVSSAKMEQQCPMGHFVRRSSKKVLFHLAGHTGLRCGEICALQVEDLKLNYGVIEVRRSVWNGIDGRTKTKAGRRVVYLDSETTEMLREYHGGRKTGRVFESRSAEHC